jgi:haloacetate dehalogenase
MSRFFPGFAERSIRTRDVEIHAVVGGSGPPLLLLHGFPQTHVIWHKVAQRLAERFTVVATDLRGYGDSSKPHGLPDHSNYSKRTMAADQVDVMRKLGFDAFSVVGHDRGGRVAHRMALDHAERIRHVTVLDIVPTRTMYLRTDRAFATAYYHWFFLIREAPFPETLIGADPAFFVKNQLGSRHAGLEPFTAEALAEYIRCFSDPAAIHSACEDYRAANSIDLVHDESDLDRKVTAPLMVLWGKEGVIERCFDAPADWAERAVSVRSQVLTCGHYIPEEAPDDLCNALVTFMI